MKGELWTMAMHQPVDTRELDRLAREIVRKAQAYNAVCNSPSPDRDTKEKLLQAVEAYETKVFEQILAEPEVEG